MNVMTIGLFQLENLAMMPTRFAFLDLRAQAAPVSSHIDNLLMRSTLVAPEKAESHLKDADKEEPVVLVCEDGNTSMEVARRLEAAGFDNVYVVSGGVAGLLSEL